MNFLERLCPRWLAESLQKLLVTIKCSAPALVRNKCKNNTFLDSIENSTVLESLIENHQSSVELCTNIIVCITECMFTVRYHLSYTWIDTMRRPQSLPHVARALAPRSARSSCLVPTTLRASLLTVGSLARECDRRKLFVPAECRKFGRAEWGTLYD